jgi:hypothetical protein
MSSPQVIVKKSPLRGLTTELREGDTITVDGPATFRIIKTNHNGHSQRSLINILADDCVKILKGSHRGEKSTK